MNETDFPTMLGAIIELKNQTSYSTYLSRL